MSLETVTYLERTLAGVLTATHTGVMGLRRATIGTLVGAGGRNQVAEQRTRWHLQASTLTVVPKRGDRIVSAVSGAWEVLQGDSCTFSTRYALPCKKVP